MQPYNLDDNIEFLIEKANRSTHCTPPRAGYVVLLRRGAKAWMIWSTEPYWEAGNSWDRVFVKCWRDVVTLIQQVATEHVQRNDLRDAMLRALPKTPVNHAYADVRGGHNTEPGKAIADYGWWYKDTDRKRVSVSVNERGGMHGGATFHGIAPYPVPGYDTDRIDHSSGG